MNDIEELNSIQRLITTNRSGIILKAIKKYPELRIAIEKGIEQAKMRILQGR